jgi:hypothetical protein
VHWVCTVKKKVSLILNANLCGASVESFGYFGCIVGITKDWLGIIGI